MRIAAAAYPLDFLADWAAFRSKLSAWVADAADHGAQLLVFPEYASMELASLGGAAAALKLEASIQEVARHGEPSDALHAELAQRHGVHILAASRPVFADPAQRPVNRAVLFGPQGRIGHQDKRMMTRFEREQWHIGAGQDLAILDTPLGRIGVIICYDSEFPLLARALAEAGAEILLVPSCTDSLAGYTRVRVGSMARALENQCAVVHAPTVGPAPWCPAVDENWGAAAIYGPADRDWPASGILAEGRMNEPGWVYADVDLAKVRQSRADGHVLPYAHWPEQHAALARVRRFGSPG